MSQERAITVAQAQAQTPTLTLPVFEHWRRFAASIDGYRIADELGFDLWRWADEKIKHWEATQQWDLDVLSLRLLLFATFRIDYMSGWTYTEQDECVDSILQELSRLLDLPYTPKDT
jgi:hypothetical protein